MSPRWRFSENHGDSSLFSCVCCFTAQIVWRASLLPLPATQEWGEDRGEGHSHTTSLLSPALSSIRWRRGSFLACRFEPRSSFELINQLKLGQHRHRPQQIFHAFF